MIYDADADRPIYAGVSAANVNDITVAQQMPIEPGATYVFDLGYYDYAWWAQLDAVGCRIVTRFNSNTPLQAAEELPLPQQGSRVYRSSLSSRRPARGTSPISRRRCSTSRPRPCASRCRPMPRRSDEATLDGDNRSGQFGLTSLPSPRQAIYPDVCDFMPEAHPRFPEE